MTIKQVNKIIKKKVTDDDFKFFIHIFCDKPIDDKEEVKFQETCAKYGMTTDDMTAWFGCVGFIFALCK